MDFWDLTKLLKRRWYLSLPLLILTGVAGLYVLTSTKPDYVATSHVQVFPPASRPAQPGEPSLEQRNPWMTLGVYNLANAAMLTITQKSVVDSLVAAGLSDAYTATLSSGMPIVTLEVTASSQEQAIATSNELIKRFSTSVNDLQTQVYAVTAADLATARSIDLGGNVAESTGRVKRAVIGVVGAGLVLTLAVSVGVDALAGRRRRRQAGAPDGLSVGDLSPVVPVAPPPRVTTPPQLEGAGAGGGLPGGALDVESADQSAGNDGTVVLPLAYQTPRRRDDRGTGLR